MKNAFSLIHGKWFMLQVKENTSEQDIQISVTETHIKFLSASRIRLGEMHGEDSSTEGGVFLLPTR